VRRFTYGVMVSRRCKIALHFAGVPASDGDVLRRAMSGTLCGCVTKVKTIFLHVVLQGHPLALSQEYRQIESFAGTPFCKHSASYAVESYQSLYLKVHYPVEFMVAVNNQGGFYRTEVYVHEAKMSGGIINTLVSTKVNVKLLYMELTST
jgi:DNA polymerase-3 subunit alpha/error-prone DNA polymerase